MEIKKNIGKNTLGDTAKMNVDLRTYNRSTHNLSHAWRSTMGVGTLVPCFKQVALPGDTWDIEIDTKVLTHPTVGPLFGSYKMQVDFFTCPMRLYMAPLHNNAINVGMDMSRVKIPKLSLNRIADKDIKYSSSSILSYLGIKGVIKGTTDTKVNALPLLSYIDIFKNYYANKQENNFYAIFNTPKTVTITDKLTKDTQGYINGGTIVMKAEDDPNKCSFIVKAATERGSFVGKAAWENNGIFDKPIENKGIYVLNWNNKSGKKWKTLEEVTTIGEISTEEIDLSEFDDLRDEILAQGYKEYVINRTNRNFYLDKVIGLSSGGRCNAEQANAGLILKTLQSDLFNNWVKTEWVEEISKKSAVAVVSDAFTVDSLNLAKKVYDMLNRIAVSGGTYRDWMETVYTAEGYGHVETPIYEGGMSCEIEFQEVVSNSASGEQPLGTLGGRGVSTNKKGGSLHIKITEPSYIMAIASITPRVDYSQGYDWDILGLNTMNDLHKPALDGIGFQDLMTKWMHYNTNGTAIGKQPAWIQYMTAVNRTYGNFAAGESEAFMCLNRIYEADGTKVLNPSTYINPEDYIYQFAERSLESQDFWVQIGYNVQARRVMSAKQIPNL